MAGKGAQARSFADLPAEAVVELAGERSDLPLQLAEPLAASLAAEGLDALYRDMELPLVPGARRHRAHRGAGRHGDSWARRRRACSRS